MTSEVISDLIFELSSLNNLCSSSSLTSTGLGLIVSHQLHEKIAFGSLLQEKNAIF